MSAQEQREVAGAQSDGVGPRPPRCRARRLARGHGAREFPAGTGPAVLKVFSAVRRSFRKYLLGMSQIFPPTRSDRLICTSQRRQACQIFKYQRLRLYSEEFFFSFLKALAEIQLFNRIVTFVWKVTAHPSGLLFESPCDTQRLQFTTKKGSFCSHMKGSSNKNASPLSHRNIRRMD